MVESKGQGIYAPDDEETWMIMLYAGVCSS
jgi:hypothetical protein